MKALGVLESKWDPIRKKLVRGILEEQDRVLRCVCVLLLQDLLQSCSRGGRRRVEDMCYERRRAEACVDESAHHALRSHFAQKGGTLSKEGRTGAIARPGTCPRDMYALRRHARTVAEGPHPEVGSMEISFFLVHYVPWFC